MKEHSLLHYPLSMKMRGSRKNTAPRVRLSESTSATATTTATVLPHRAVLHLVPLLTAKETKPAIDSSLRQESRALSRLLNRHLKLVHVTIWDAWAVFWNVSRIEALVASNVDVEGRIVYSLCLKLLLKARKDALAIVQDLGRVPKLATRAKRAKPSEVEGAGIFSLVTQLAVWTTRTEPSEICSA